MSLKMVQCPVTCPKCRNEFDPKPNKVFTVKCVICAVQFDTPYKTSLYCSDKCYRRSPGEVRRRKRESDRRKSDPQYAKKWNDKAKEYAKLKWKQDPVFRAVHNGRSRIRAMLKSRGVRYSKRMGCSSSELKIHLEKQFYDGMQWNNYGTYWVVDHIKPLASFDFSDPRQAVKACHFTNLQPLTRPHNEEKAARLDWERPNFSAKQMELV